MRIWHKDLIPILPRMQLQGQWRECCAIARNIERKGTPNHVLVNRVMDYPKDDFITYADLIFREMQRRGYRVAWGRFAEPMRFMEAAKPAELIYREWHNDRYMRQCLTNMQEKADCGAIPAEEWKRITDRFPEFE